VEKYNDVFYFYRTPEVPHNKQLTAQFYQIQIVTIDISALLASSKFAGFCVINGVVHVSIINSRETIYFLASEFSACDVEISQET
jgi:hypothetical protein